MNLQGSSGESGANQPQPPPAPATGATNNVLHALARAVSVPLATVILQALVGSSPALQSVSSPEPQLELSQLIKQVFQSAASSPGAIQPQVNGPYSPGLNQGRGNKSLRGRG